MIADALKRGLNETYVYKDSKSRLEANRHRAIAEIKDLLKHRGVKIFAHCIKAHVGHLDNERLDALTKVPIECHRVDVVVKLTTRWDKTVLLARALAKWQDYWDYSTTGTCKIFLRVSLRRHNCDFCHNQASTGYSTFDNHQARFRNKLNYPCFAPVSTIQHCLYVCPS